MRSSLRPGHVFLPIVLALIGLFMSNAALAHAAPMVPGIVETVESTVVADSPCAGIGTYASLRSIVRGFDGKLHVAWSETGVASPRVYYSCSLDNGRSWSAPFVVRDAGTVADQPTLKIDGDSRVHIIWAELTVDYTRSMHRYVDASGKWSAVYALSTGTSDEIGISPNPAIDASGVMSLVFDRSHYRGIGLKTWNGVAWSSTSAILSYTRDNYSQNTVPVGMDLHTFTYDSGYQKIVNTSRIGGAWMPASAITTFTVVPDHSEVLDRDGFIRLFMVDRQNDSRLMTCVMQTTTRVITGWEVVDSEPGLDARQPSSTIDHLGNVWVFYALGDEVCYKVYDRAMGGWTERQYFTDTGLDGTCDSPKVRYQVFNHRAGGRIDLTYRSYPAGGPYSLAYRGLVLSGTNDLPRGVADEFSLQIDGGRQVASPGVLANDQDPDRDPLTAKLGTNVQHGTLTFTSDGAFEYTPFAGWSGTDSFDYTCSDGFGESEPATVSLVVIGPYAPVAADDAFTSNSGHNVVVAAPGVLANDSDGNTEDILSAVLASAPSTGSLELAADGSFEYTPPIGYREPVTFTYRATDGGLESAVATVTLTLNRGPVALAESYSVQEYDSLSRTALDGLLANDSDPDGDALSVAVTQQPAHGTLGVQADGSFEYVPTSGYSGADTFKYQVSDGMVESAVLTVRITVVAGAAVDGHVYDSLTGEPVPGVVVRAVNAEYADPVGGPSRIAVTDSNGHYRVTGLVDDSFDFVSFIDTSGTYRDQHLWGQTIPIEASYPGYFVDLTSGVDAYLMPESKSKLDRITRISGSSRYDTAVRASQFWRSSDVVVLASGVGYADALSAAPLAGSYDAPILLTSAATLPPAVSAEITRLKAGRVIIVGGTGAVSAAIENGLRARGISVTRVSGADRYATCLAITRHLIWREGADLPLEPFIVRGDSYADALAVAPFAWNQVRPIILVKPTGAPDAAVTAFTDLGSDAVIIVGGEGAVSDDALFDLWFGALYPDGLDLTYWRVSGVNRYDTAAKVGRFWAPNYDSYVLASGQSFPDALAGGPLMGAFGGAMLLTAPQSLSPEAAAVLNEDRTYISRGWMLGGEKALAPGVLDAANSKVGTALYQMDGYSGVLGASAPIAAAAPLFGPFSSAAARVAERMPERPERMSVEDLRVEPEIFVPAR